MTSALRISVLVNIALAGIVTVLLWRDQSAIRLRAASIERTASARFKAQRSDLATHEPQPGPAGPTLTRSAVAQLEKLGISREVLMSVLLEDLNRRSATRVLELQKKYAPRLAPDREMRALTRQNDAEQVSDLKEAFGEEGYLAWDKEETLHNLNRARMPGDDLPMTPEEGEEAYRLQKEFDEKTSDLQMAMEDGVADKADVGALQAQAQQSLDAELQKLLGKQRFDELRGNTDPTTDVYRTYGDLNPTPEQANAVVLAEQDYRAKEAAMAKQLTQTPGDIASVTSQLKAMSDAEDQNLRQIFGSDAYESMKRQNDATQALQQYAGAWNLNNNEMQQVYDSVHDFQQQADRIRSAAQLSEQAGQRVDWNAVNASIDQVQQQTEMGLQNTIGPDRLHRLEQNGLLTLR